MKRLVLGLGILAAVACSENKTVEATVVPSLTKPVAAVKLYAMDCGRIAFKDAAMFADDDTFKGVKRELVDPCYLIRHERGDLIWDTGLPEAIADMPDGVSRDGFPATMKVPKKLTAQLAELGLAPGDIDFVSFSHMHSDHTGNGNLFAGATWIVDKDERDAMFSEDARKGEDFANYSALETATTTLLTSEDDFDVFGDGSAIIVQAPGHTPGHTVLLLTTANSGKVILAGDMWHLKESREKRTVPAFNVDREKTLASMDKVEALALAQSAKVIRQHVAEDFNSLPKFPAALE